MSLIKSYINEIPKYICLLLTVFFASGCASGWLSKVGDTDPLTANEEAVEQIYVEKSGCKKIAEISEENIWNGSFKDVKNRLKRAAAAKGGNAYMIDKVSGQRRKTDAFVYFCKD